MKKLFKKDNIFLAGAHGMVGKAIFRALKKMVTERKMN